MAGENVQATCNLIGRYRVVPLSLRLNGLEKQPA
jgi:hypothetical protein